LGFAAVDRPQTGFAAGRPPPKAGRNFAFTATKKTPAAEPELRHNSHMSIHEQQTPPVEDRIGAAVGKVIALGLFAFLLWGYSTTFLAQVGLF